MVKVRLSKVMAERGLASRREADRLIAKGDVFVDGAVVTELGFKVDPTVSIMLRRSSSKHAPITVALHKSMGVVSMPDDRGKYPVATSLLTKERCAHRPERLPRLNVAGRLDIDSTGLLILTEDGTVASALIHPNSAIEKEYHIEVRGEITDSVVERLSFGLSLDGKPLKRAEIAVMGLRRLKIVLREGKKRQIRRMCQLVGLEVTKLMRVRIGGLKLGSLKYGQWKRLSQQEIDLLCMRIERV